MGNSLEVQWLRLHAFTAEGLSSNPHLRSKILQAVWCEAKKNKKRERERERDPNVLLWWSSG